MNKNIIRTAVFLLLSACAIYAQGEVDSDFMTTMEDLNKSLTSNIAIKDAKAGLSDAKEMESMFNEVHAFFVKKADAADGVQWSLESKDLSSAIVKALSSNDFDAASQTAVTLSKTCKACHKIYKKKD